MTNKTTTTTAARVETVNAAAMPSITVKYYSYTDAVQGIRDTLEKQGWIVADLAFTAVFSLPRMVNGAKNLDARTVGYGLTGNVEKAFYLSRYAMAIERKARTAEKAAEKDADKKPVANMLRELRDALRLFPVDMPDKLPADAPQVYLAFLAGSVDSKTDLTENPVLALLEKGFSEVKAEVEKAKKENRAPSNTKVNAACKDMVQQYGGTMIARAKTKTLADTLNAIFYPVQRIDRKTGLIKSYSAAWFRGFEQYALLIARAALENTGEKTAK